MAFNFVKTQPNANRKYLKQVQDWVEDMLPESYDEDALVMVNEMQCYEPGCAPLETVISLLGKQSVVFKIFKPVAEVAPEDVTTALNDMLSGRVAPEHAGQAPPPPQRQQPETMEVMECMASEG